MCYSLNYELANDTEDYYDESSVDPLELEEELFLAGEYEQALFRKNELTLQDDDYFDDEYAPWEREDDPDDE